MHVTNWKLVHVNTGIPIVKEAVMPGRETAERHASDDDTFHHRSLSSRHHCLLDDGYGANAG